MPQDVLDDLRVIDERHNAHLVMTLGKLQRINFPDLLDQLAPRTRWNAPRLEREMLDDFNRRAYFRTTPLLCCCRGLARCLLLRLLFTLPALTAHLVGIPAVVTHHHDTSTATLKSFKGNFQIAFVTTTAARSSAGFRLESLTQSRNGDFI